MTRERICRPPSAPLRPFIQLLWAVDEEENRTAPQRREHVLPTGHMHLVFRLREDPLRLFTGPDDRVGMLAGRALVGGARDTFYRREISGAQCSVGVQFHAGGAEALLGIPAGELAGRHTPVDDIWGAAPVASLSDRLATMPLDRRLDALETALLARMPRMRALHPAVAQALSHFTLRSDVGGVVAASGYSHRTLVTLFHRSVGLAPKQYASVQRFARALKDLRRGRGLADVAFAAGYSDQAHFSRAFREFAGTTPFTYLRTAPPDAHHLPVA